MKCILYYITWYIYIYIIFCGKLKTMFNTEHQVKRNIKLANFLVMNSTFLISITWTK